MVLEFCFPNRADIHLSNVCPLAIEKFVCDRIHNNKMKNKYKNRNLDSDTSPSEMSRWDAGYTLPLRPTPGPASEFKKRAEHMKSEHF